MAARIGCRSEIRRPFSARGSFGNSDKTDENGRKTCHLAKDLNYLCYQVLGKGGDEGSELLLAGGKGNTPTRYLPTLTGSSPAWKIRGYRIHDCRSLKAQNSLLPLPIHGGGVTALCTLSAALDVSPASILEHSVAVLLAPGKKTLINHFSGPGVSDQT